MNYITRILALVLLIMFVCTTGLIACAPANEAVLAITPEPTPTVTATPTQEPTPTPTPTPEPTPTPLPELTLEQKELLLGINEQATPITVDRVIVTNYSLNGKKYRCWAFFENDVEKTKESPTLDVYNIYDLFNGHYLFSISLPNKGIYTDGNYYPISMFKCFLSETNPVLSGMKLDMSFALCEVSPYYDEWEVDYNNDPTLKYFGDIYENGTPEQRNEVRDTVLMLEDQSQIFLNSTPQEEIMPFWVYTPGAQIPEELKAFYSEADYPPAPTE